VTIPPGTEWVVDAHGCDPESLRSPAALKAVFERVVRELRLSAAGDPIWRVFPGEGGITGLLLLSESHLACHTFPERGFAAFNLYCCRPRDAWPWPERLREALGATDVSVTTLVRGMR
jgi:S-adenosylmethionine decarboxylase